MKADTAVALLIALLREANALGATIQKARDEGREDITDAELDAVVGRDDLSRERLQAKIDAL